MKLSYIELINGFWTYYDANKSKISPSDITLYMVLLRYCNKLDWINPFTINPFLMAEVNPLSQNTYYKSLKNLNDFGLIKWEKGKHNVSNLKITIIKIKTSINNSIDNSIKFSINNSINDSIVNNNKTIIQSKQLDNKKEYTPEIEKLYSELIPYFADVQKFKVDNPENKDVLIWCNKNQSIDLETLKKVLIFGRTDEFWKANFIAFKGLKKISPSNGNPKILNILAQYKASLTKKQTYQQTQSNKIEINLDTANNPNRLSFGI